MTTDEWNGIAMLLDKGFKWRDPFAGAKEQAYRLLLDGIAPEQLANAIRALVAKGQVFGPAPGEIVDVLYSDTAVPTFPELAELVYGPDGVMHAGKAGVALYRRQKHQATGSTWVDLTDRDKAFYEAAVDRAGQFHPLVGAFVQRQTVRRLRNLELDDPEYGQVRRRDLERDWVTHCEAMEGRDLSEIAAGGERGRGELSRFDPMAAIRPQRPELAA